MNPSNDFSRLLFVSKNEPNSPLNQLENSKFLKIKHLGQILLQNQTKFYTLDKHFGDNNFASHLYMNEFFHGEVILVNQINPIFCLLNHNFIQANLKNWLDCKTENSSKSQEENNKIKITDSSASVDFELKFLNIDQFEAPFNNFKILDACSDIFDTKEVDIGEDEPLKVYRFNVEKFYTFIESKLNLISQHSLLVSSGSEDKFKDAFLRSGLG